MNKGQNTRGYDRDLPPLFVPLSKLVQPVGSEHVG